MIGLNKWTARACTRALLLNTCGCVCVAIMVVGGAFSVTMALVPDESATAVGLSDVRSIKSVPVMLICRR